MNLGDLANLGQIIGAVAVVISLFYGAHQIRQTLVQKIVEGTMRIDNFFNELVFTSDGERK